MDENRDVGGVGIFPKAKEILEGSLCSDGVTCQHVGAGQLHACQRPYRIVPYNIAVLENLIEFNRGLGPMIRTQISQTAHIDRIQVSVESIHGTGRSAEFVVAGIHQHFDGTGRVSFQDEQSAKRGQIIKLDFRILPELRREFVRELQSLS